MVPTSQCSEQVANHMQNQDREQLLTLYRQMTTIREFELRAINERRGGLIPGFIHSCVGQEATAVGACAALRSDDVITSTHRGHGHLIAKGGDPKYMMAELAARDTGYCGGKGGSLHMADFDLGILGANGIVAGGIPIAVGAALAFKMRGEDRVGLAFFGDGAVNEGAFHEAANMAGLWKLPVIFFCENNLYGEGTPQSKQAPVADLSLRAEGYAFPGVIVDGNDVLAVHQVIKAAAEYARSGGGASLIENVTYRWRGHSKSDRNLYRTPEEIESWKERCPILRFKQVLVDGGVMDAEEAEAIDREARATVDRAAEEALTFAEPSPENIEDEVYAP